MTSTAHEGSARVTTLELFFDLVFVFTITQLTSVLFRDPNGRGLLQVGLILTVVWWMYGGYAWMTNAVRANTGARRPLSRLRRAFRSPGEPWAEPLVEP